ncbi:MAG: Maf family protein [Acidobacteriota bacterium]|nr:Maf family protein [Acidobacteriota bacterium]
MSGRRTRPKWILASASPRRRELLSGLGLKFLLDPSGIVEPQRNPREPASKYAVRVACLKAREVSQRHASGLILSADTIVVRGNSILGKPESLADARRMLRQLSGRWHEVITGLCVLECPGKRMQSTFSRTRVRFRRLTTAEIDWYLKTGEYADKAGAYGIQGGASLFIDRIEGCYFNIVGFPISAFEKLCRKSGINLLNDLRFEIRDFCRSKKSNREAE